MWLIMYNHKVVAEAETIEGARLAIKTMSDDASTKPNEYLIVFSGNDEHKEPTE